MKLKNLLLIPLLMISICVSSQTKSKKISELPVATLVNSTDVILINQGDTTKTVPYSVLLDTTNNIATKLDLGRSALTSYFISKSGSNYIGSDIFAKNITTSTNINTVFTTAYNVIDTGGIIAFRNGTYTPNTTFNLTNKDVSIIGGENVYFETNTPLENIFKCTGIKLKDDSLKVNIVAANRYIVGYNITGVKTGDILTVIDSLMNIQESIEVNHISSDTIYLREPLKNSYNKSYTSLIYSRPITVKFENLNFICNHKYGYYNAIEMDYSKNCIITKCNFKDCGIVINHSLYNFIKDKNTFNYTTLNDTCTLYYDAIFTRRLYIANPGEGNDIRASILAAVNLSTAGDTLILPIGNFPFVGTYVEITKKISIVGAGKDKTILYRPESIVDADIANLYMLYFNINSSVANSHILIADFTVKSKKPADIMGANGSLAIDNGIGIVKALDFVVTRMRFENFGVAGLYIKSTDTLSRGLVYKNEFIHCFKGNGLGYGYGCNIVGDNYQWTALPNFGTSNFIYIEDNVFEQGGRHAIAGQGCGRYVARYNTFRDFHIVPALDMHAARGNRTLGTSDYFGTRVVEAYHNTIINSKYYDGGMINPLDTTSAAVTRMTAQGILFNAGESVVYDNYIQGYQTGIALAPPSDTVGSSYPMRSQIGYWSGKIYGRNHTGTTSEYANGDAFIWNNRFKTTNTSVADNIIFREILDTHDSIKIDRDYHLSAKPNYISYTYPHPLRIKDMTFCDRGVTIKNSNGCEVSGNTYTNTPRKAVYVTDSKNVVISNNNISTTNSVNTKNYGVILNTSINSIVDKNIFVTKNINGYGIWELNRGVFSYDLGDYNRISSNNLNEVTTWGNRLVKSGANSIFTNNIGYLVDSSAALILKDTSSVVRHAHNAEATSTSATYVIIKTILLPEGLRGKCKIKFDYKSSTGLIYAYVGLNDSRHPMSNAYNSTSATYVTCSQYYTWDFQPGDRVQLFVHSTAGATVSVQNFQIMYDNVTDKISVKSSIY